MPQFPNEYTEKTSPTGADKALIADSEATNQIKSLSLTNIKNWLQTLTKWVTTAMVNDEAIDTPQINDGAVTPEKLTPTTWASNMSALNPVTTSYTNLASVTLPATTAAHKYLIIGNFMPNHDNGANPRDYSCAIRNGTTTLAVSIWSGSSGTYLNPVPVSTVFTGSSSGGETINFSVLRSTSNGGLTSNIAHYVIIDLGLA